MQGDDVPKLTWWQQELWLDIENPRTYIDVATTPAWPGYSQALTDALAAEADTGTNGDTNGTGDGNGTIPPPPPVGQWWWSMDDEVWYPMDSSPATP